MKSGFFVVLATISVGLMGCSNDGDTEPIKPSTSTNTASGNNPGPADLNPAKQGGQASAGDMPIGELRSNKVTKF